MLNWCLAVTTTRYSYRSSYCVVLSLCILSQCLNQFMLGSTFLVPYWWRCVYLIRKGRTKAELADVLHHWFSSLSADILCNAKKVTDHGLTEIVPQSVQLKFKMVIFGFTEREWIYNSWFFRIPVSRSSLVSNQGILENFYFYNGLETLPEQSTSFGEPRYFVRLLSSVYLGIRFHMKHLELVWECPAAGLHSDNQTP